MAREDWDYINLPKTVVERLDEFLDSAKGKRLGFKSRQELVKEIINRFLESHRFA